VDFLETVGRVFRRTARARARGRNQLLRLHKRILT
jgi:hypothetical protein